MSRKRPPKQKKEVNTELQLFRGEPKLLEQVEAKTPNQEDFVRSIVENDITIVNGVAGSGKSFVGIGIACQYLIEGKVDNILYCRSIVASGDSIGFLPGGLSEKTSVYMESGLEYFNRFLGVQAVDDYISKKVIRLYPVELLRGHTYHNSFMIIDEASSVNPRQLKLFMSRMGTNSKMLIVGDNRQSDIRENGLLFLNRYMRDIKGIGFVELTKQDIQRHGLLVEILTRFEDNGI